MNTSAKSPSKQPPKSGKNLRGSSNSASNSLSDAKPRAKTRKKSQGTPNPLNPKGLNNHKSFFSRLNIRFPWLKIAIIPTLIAIAALDLLSLTISKTLNPPVEATIAPMLKHVRVTERDLMGKHLIALTFDDGPSRATTPELLDTLQEKQVPATFFMLGNLARNNPDLVRRAEKEGHEIATHTLSHQNLIRLSTSDIKADLKESTSIFKDILGHGPAYLRPPYGNYNETVSENAGVPIILWSVDTLDWKYRNTESILDLTLSQISEGGIILMHDVHPTSVEAVPTLIDALRKEGYEFVTISDLAKAHHKSLTPGTAYYNIKP